MTNSEYDVVLVDDDASMTAVFDLLVKTRAGLRGKSYNRYEEALSALRAGSLRARVFLIDYMLGTSYTGDDLARAIRAIDPQAILCKYSAISGAIGMIYDQDNLYQMAFNKESPISAILDKIILLIEAQKYRAVAIAESPFLPFDDENTSSNGVLAAAAIAAPPAPVPVYETPRSLSDVFYPNEFEDELQTEMKSETPALPQKQEEEKPSDFLSPDIFFEEEIQIAAQTTQISNEEISMQKTLPDFLPEDPFDVLFAENDSPGEKTAQKVTLNQTALDEMFVDVLSDTRPARKESFHKEDTNNGFQPPPQQTEGRHLDELESFLSSSQPSNEFLFSPPDEEFGEFADNRQKDEDYYDFFSSENEEEKQPPSISASAEKRQPEKKKIALILLASVFTMLVFSGLVWFGMMALRTLGE